MKRFFLIIKTSSKNWVTLLYFEIIYKTFGFTVVFPLLRYLLSLLPRFVGVDYLAQENILLLFTKPLALWMGFGILILAASYITYEIMVFILLCEAGWHRERMTVLQVIRQASVKSLTLLKPDKIGVFTMLILLTFSVFSPVSGYLKWIRFPDFILEYIRADTVFLLLYSGMLALFHLLLFFYLFGLPLMFLSGQSFTDSWKRSLELLRGRKLRTAGIVIIQNLCFLFLIVAGVLALFLVIGICTKLSDMENGRQQLELILSSRKNVGIIAGSAITNAYFWGTVIVLYHQYQGELQPPDYDSKTRWKRVLSHTASSTLLICLLLFFTETEIGGNVPSFGGRPMIIAHRAGAASAPENTLAALYRSVEDNSDAVEIDIQQLGDGTLIVMHDNNFRRTTGLDLNVRDADYPMIQGLDAGAAYDPKGSPNPIPTLEDFIRNAKGKCRLMLELKSSGHENNMEENVLHLIKKYNMEDECMIASMDLSILRTIKELDPEIETVYISMLLISSQYDLNFVDGYSVETTSLSRGMTIQAHLQNKKIYVWTVNSEYAVKKGLRCGVDGLITDTPRAALMTVSKYGDSPLVRVIVNLLY